MVLLFPSSSWAEAVYEPSSSNFLSDAFPLPSSDVPMDVGMVGNLPRDGSGVLTSPSSDARLFAFEMDNVEVPIMDEKYWFDQVASLRSENADLCFEKQRALSLVEQLRGDCFALQETNKQLWIQLTEAQRVLGDWTAYCRQLEDSLRWH
eukprot:161086-Karenia_brevis.AAC.1